MNRVLSVSWSGLLLGLVPAPLAAQSRDLANIEDVSLEELLGADTSVASTKSMQLRASPGAITMITREEILRLGARDLADVLPLVPGFDLGSDVSGVVGISFRGNWAHEGKALIMVDGIEMNETQYLNVPVGGHFPLDDVDRIEILRGPGSARYAELCVINITTRSGAQKHAVDVTGTYGYVETPLSNGSVGASAGTTLDALGGLDLSLHASYAQQPRSERAYQDVFGSSFDMSQQSTIRAPWINPAVAASWLKVRLVLDGYALDDRTSYTSILESAPPTSFPAAYLTVSSPWELSPTLSFNARLVLQRQLPWWSFAEDVDAAVAAAAADVVFFLRPFAVGTLRDANPLRDAVEVSVEMGSDGRERIRVAFAGAPAVVTVAGVDEDIVVDGHGVARVRQWLEGSAVVQSATRTEGRRLVRITPVQQADHAGIVVDVRFESPQLGAPLVYRLRYQQA